MADVLLQFNLYPVQKKINHRIIIDWLQFTVMNMSHIYVINDLLKLDLTLFSEMERGKLGYLKQMQYGNISVCYAGSNKNNDMGVHVILTGTGCRLYETFHPLIELIESINVYEGKLTRIDIALDDRSGDLIKFNHLLDDIKKGNIVSKWKTSLEIIKRDLNGNKLGESINVGSRTSNTYLRIYDKALEQNLQGEIWYRIELEIKKTNAETIQNLLTADNAGLLMRGILNNYMRMVVPNKNDINKSRWKTRPYWDKLIGDVDKVRLTQAGEEKTIAQIKSWVERQVGSSLALIAIHEQGELTFLEQIITEKSKTLSAKHRRILKGGE